DLYHHRFWSQAIRWAASDKPLLTGNRFVRFGTPQPVYSGGEPVKLVVRLSELAGADLAKLKVQARILRKDGPRKEEAAAVGSLRRRPLQRRVSDGTVRDLPGGQYSVELVIPGMEDKLKGPPGPDGNPAPLRSIFSVNRAESGEMLQLATNWDLLQEMA